MINISQSEVWGDLKQQIKDHPRAPLITHTHSHKTTSPDDLERLGIIGIERRQGKPQLSFHALPNCNLEGCIAHEHGLHCIIEIRGSYSYASLCPRCGELNARAERIVRALPASAYGQSMSTFDFSDNPNLTPLLQSTIIDGHGGFIWGDYGNGKTHIACAVARHCIWRGLRVKYLSHQQLLNQIKKSWNDEGTSDPRYKWLEDVDLIIWDELGFCPKTEWAKQTTSELIHALHSSGVSALFISNLSPDELKKSTLHPRAHSRMGDLCSWRYQMQGGSRRGAF